MDKALIKRIVSLNPQLEQRAVDLNSKLVLELNSIGLQYLHIGADVSSTYVVLPSDGDLNKLNKVLDSCNVIVSGSGYLQLESREPFGKRIESIEQALEQRPIDYCISLDESLDQMIGVCTECGGVGRHIPPCPI